MTEMKHKAETIALEEVGTAETDAAAPAGTRTSAAESTGRQAGVALTSSPREYFKDSSSVARYNDHTQNPSTWRQRQENEELEAPWDTETLLEKISNNKYNQMKTYSHAKTKVEAEVRKLVQGQLQAQVEPSKNTFSSYPCHPLPPNILITLILTPPPTAVRLTLKRAIGMGWAPVHFSHDKELCLSSSQDRQDQSLRSALTHIGLCSLFKANPSPSTTQSPLLHCLSSWS